MLEQPISLEELQQLLQRRGNDLGKSRNAEHLLNRVIVTMQAYNHRIGTLTRDVETMRARMSEVTGRTSTLDPLTAAQFLSPQDRKSLCDELVRSYLTQVESVVQDMEETRREMMRIINSIRKVVVELDEDPTFDPSAKTKLLAALARLPSPSAASALDSQADQLASRAGLITAPYANTPTPPNPAAPPPQPPGYPPQPPAPRPHGGAPQ